MSSEYPLSVLFLWHQHQPFYKDPLSNRYELPWVRLHAIKDYYDMVALLDEFPKIRANFNLVPSLLIQLDDYAQGKAHDKFVGLTEKPASELSFEDRQFILQNFFMANWDNMIDPYPRYRELLEKRGRNAGGEALSRAQNYFKEQDWRDLQTWFNLAWFDPLWRERDPLIKMLHEKGRGFTEEEKHRLIRKQLEICGLVTQKHRQMMEKGQIEITATPYYHPILPLLCDTEAAKMALPQITLPQRFSHPEDARKQIERALEDHRARFGRQPQGMWPSEGSVSEPVARLFIESGVRWIATDEAVLARSVEGGFDHDQLYQPWQFKAEDKSLSFFFRDHDLSDAIGFVYTSWNAEDAVNDFMKRLQGIRERLRIKDGDKPRPHVVSVILDGENCWEYYKNDGLPFLRLLYGRLSEEPGIQTVRASDFLDQAGELQTLSSKLWSGSWINSNFAIWIGHQEDNQAWDVLSRTRKFLRDHLETHPELAGTEPAQLAWESIYIAEGSDWCWWYGDDHSSANDDMFDFLFRKHLMNVYTVLGVPIPDDLHLPIKTKKTRSQIKPPVDFVTPHIDGKVTSYFEWQSAGLYETEAGGSGTMHRAQNLIKAIYYGFDLLNLYFRLDLSKPLEEDLYKDITFKWAFLQPLGIEIAGHLQKGGDLNLQLFTKSMKDGNSSPKPLPPGKIGRIIELAIPLRELKAPQNQPLKWTLIIERNELEQERWPLDAVFEVPCPTPETFAESWVI